MLLIENSPECNALLQCMTFPPVVQAVPRVFLSCDGRKKFHLWQADNMNFHHCSEESCGLLRPEREEWQNWKLPGLPLAIGNLL